MTSDRPKLTAEIKRLRRLLRAACSTLECQRVDPGAWSGELIAWRRRDRGETGKPRTI